MLYKFLLKERRVIQFYTLILFIILSLVLLLVTYYVQLGADQVQRTETEIIAQGVVDIDTENIARGISRSVSDVLYIADSLLQNFENAENCIDLKQQWIAFSDRMAIYDQIRYIDQNGNEIIRINYGQDGAYVVADEDLQNKSDRYYFTDTISLPAGNVFISELDLNIENHEIEQPIKPTIRLATPVIDSNGVTQGIIVLNYLADDILQQLRQVVPQDIAVFLLNLEGYWLYNSEDSTKEWAFMYDDRPEESFADAFPEEWEIIAAGGSGFLNTPNGAFTYNNIILDKTMLDDTQRSDLLSDSGAFYIVTYIHPDSDKGELFSTGITNRLGRVFLKYLSLYFLMSGIAFVIAIFIAMNSAQKKQIKYYSEYDAMTGVYNRREGYRKLKDLKKDVAKRHCQIAVCFIDINDLKKVNDELGHDAGDELIQSIADTIKESVREHDFVARLGGDEFLIVFDRLNIEGAENVWRRIVQKFDQINEKENRSYLISASHGIGGFRCDENVTVDDIISRADTVMYEEKRRIKKGLNVIRGRNEIKPN